MTAKPKRSTIRIILVEDFHAESEIILRELKEAELDFIHEVATSAKDFKSLLGSFKPDVILSPYSLQGTNAVKLLAMVREKNVDVPMILLAFDLSEDIAIDLLAEGMEDYVLRSTIKRLPVAIKKALQRHLIQLELKLSEARLKNSESSLREAQKIAKIGSWEWKIDQDEIFFSDEIYRIYGCDPQPFTLQSVRKFIHPDDQERVGKYMVKNLEGGFVPIIEYKILSEDGKTKHVRAVTEKVLDSNGNVLKLIGTVQDITDRIQIQHELQRSQASLNEAQRIAKVGNWEWDVGTDAVWWSEEMYRIYETDKEDITLSDVKSYIHPEDRQRVSELTERDLRDDMVPVFEYRIMLPSGSVKHVISSARQVKDAQGRVIRLIGTLQDVTEKVLATQELEAQRIQRELTIQAAQIGVWSWFIETNSLDWDDRCFEIFGMERRNRTFADFISSVHPDDREIVQSRIQDALHSEIYSAEFRIDAGGVIKYLHARGKVTYDENGLPLRMDGIIIDMTERHAMEVALRENERLFRDMAESITEVFWLTDWELNEVLYVSPRYETLFGQSVDSLYQDPSSWSKAIHPDDAEHVTSRFKELALSGKYDEEYRLLMKDGTIKWVRDRSFPVFNTDGTVSRVAGITEDITKQKQDKEQIETLSLVASETMNGVLIHDPDGTVLWANKGFTHITGYATEEILGKEPWSLVGGPDTNWKLADMTYDKLKDGRSFASENALRHKDGHTVWVHVTFTPILDSSGKVTKMVSIGMDITKQKELEQLQRNMLQKLEKDNTELKKRTGGQSS